MKRAIGFVYIVIGLLLVCEPLLQLGPLPPGTTVEHSAGGFLKFLALNLGPALLILTGVVILIENVRRSVLCLVTGSAVVAGLALWFARIIGSRSATLSLLELAGVFLLASLIVLLVKRRWVLAFVGSIASAPHALLQAGLLLFMWGYTAGQGPWTLREISLIFPLVLVIASFVCALSVRTA